MSNFTKLMQQAASGVGGGDFYPYAIDNSCRFDGSSALSRTPSSSGSLTTWTFSTWIKFDNPAAGFDTIFSAGSSGTNITAIFYSNGDMTPVYDYTPEYYIRPSAKYRDTSAWYHFVIVHDTTNATASDRYRFYVNGERYTNGLQTANYPPQNQSGRINNSSYPHLVGGWAAFPTTDSTYRLGGYLAETHFCDGTAYDSSYFGEFKNGVWVPKSPSVSYGTNGFYLDYADSSNLGNDVSGNNNDYTSIGLTSSDQMVDTPTNSFPNLSIAAIRTGVTSPVLSDGNLEVTTPDGSAAITYWAFPSTGKYYFEIYYKTQVTWFRSSYHGISFADVTAVAQAGPDTVVINFEDPSQDTAYNLWGTWYSGPGVSQGEFGAVLVDMDNNEVTLYRQGSALVTSSFPAAYIGKPLRIQMGGGGNNVVVFNFGQNGTFNGSVTAQGNTDANGIGDFYYTVPTDALALCTANLPEPTIGPNSATITSEVFEPILYTGNGTSQSISTLDFQPDFTWIKNRDAADSHMLFDAVRGATKYLNSDNAAVEATDAQSLSSFNTNGFSVGSNVAVNTNTEDYVAWNWKANGSGVSNTDGDITSIVSANTDAGISVITYTGNASYGQTVGHGLGVAPQVVICKNLSDVRNWRSYFETLGATKYINLDETGAAGTYGSWNNTAPTSSVFSTTDASSADRATNYSGDNFVAYAFAEVEGFSSFGSYTGNGSTDGPFIYTGFRPAFFLIKSINAVGNWQLWDAKRDSYNVMERKLFPDITNAEQTGVAYYIDFLSNGIKLRSNASMSNQSGINFFYMAFAENPFKYSNAR